MPASRARARHCHNCSSRQISFYNLHKTVILPSHVPRAPDRPPCHRVDPCLSLSPNRSARVMSFDWLTWSNPVASWWVFLLVVSAVNIGLWLLLERRVRREGRERRRGAFRVEVLVLLCAAYVFGCAFRSVL